MLDNRTANHPNVAFYLSPLNSAQASKPCSAGWSRTKVALNRPRTPPLKRTHTQTNTFWVTQKCGAKNVILSTINQWNLRSSEFHWISPEEISKSPDHPTNRKWSITLVIVSPYPFRASHLSLNRSMGWSSKCGAVHRKIIDRFSSHISQKHPPFTSLHPFTSIYIHLHPFTSIYIHLHFCLPPFTSIDPPFSWHRKVKPVKPLGLFSYPLHPIHPIPIHRAAHQAIALRDRGLDQSARPCR